MFVVDMRGNWMRFVGRVLVRRLTNVRSVRRSSLHIEAMPIISAQLFANQFSVHNRSPTVQFAPLRDKDERETQYAEPNSKRLRIDAGAGDQPRSRAIG